jgi:hypothetical protein
MAKLDIRVGICIKSLRIFQVADRITFVEEKLTLWIKAFNEAFFVVWFMAIWGRTTFDFPLILRSMLAEIISLYGFSQPTNYIPVLTGPPLFTVTNHIRQQ